MNHLTLHKTKQDVMDAFWTLYLDHRIEKITVKAIVEKAGYHRSTFYAYFNDVYDVLEQIEASLIPTLDELAPLTAIQDSPFLPLHPLFIMYEKHEAYYTHLLSEKGDPAFASKLKNTIKPVLKTALHHQKLPEQELDFILEYLLSAMIGVLQYWMIQKQPLSHEQLSTLLISLTQKGIFSLIPPSDS